MVKAKRPDRSLVSMEDAGLFIATVADVKPLRRKKKNIIPTASSRSDERLSTKPRIRSIAVKAEPQAKARSSPADLQDMDRRTAERFRRGQMTLEAKVDLHGQTRDAALHRLSRFLQQSFAAGRRCVLVITGKGTKGTGVLRREFPLWLEASDLRSLVLGVAPAQAKDGGSGAFYVLLRRKR